MKFNAKQIENLARVFGSIASASAIGLGVGIARPETISVLEKSLLGVVCLVSIFTMMLILKDPK